jgi:hypothetical protein
VASYLPSREALKEDRRRADTFDPSFVLGAYVQPELREKVKLPDLDQKRLIELGFVEELPAIDEESSCAMDPQTASVQSITGISSRFYVPFLTRAKTQ